METGETIFFEFGAQQSAFSLIVGKATTTNEHFLVTLYDNTHKVIGTENVVLTDGSPLVVDAAHWGVGGTTTAPFGNFYEVDIKNVATGGAEDSSIVITGFKYNQQVVIGDTALNFHLAVTDGDRDTFTSTDNLTVSLFGTHTDTGYQLTGTNTTSEVLVASAGPDTLIGGTGPGDTVDYSQAASGVTVDLTLETDTVAAGVGVSGGSFGDTIKGIENVIGSSFADTLTAHPSGSILDGGANSTGGSGIDTLIGGAGNDVLIASRLGVDSLTSNGGNDTFVLHGDGAASVTINDFNLSGTDSIVVDVANLNLTINTAQLASYTSAPTGANDQTHDSTFAANQFFFNTTTDHLYYSADHTAANAVDLAHISTGLPATGAIHVA
jgi:Ca2+-binding RTX toxin-like protein